MDEQGNPEDGESCEGPRGKHQGGQGNFSETRLRSVVGVKNENRAHDEVGTPASSYRFGALGSLVSTWPGALDWNVNKFVQGGYELGHVPV